MCICVLMFTCVYMCACGVQRKISGIFIDHMPTLNLEDGASLTEAHQLAKLG